MCTKHSSNPVIPVSQHGKSFTVLNAGRLRVKQTDVDGCAITVGVRCDYLFSYGGSEIFVELKGADICHAVNQIIRSVEILSKVSREKRIAAIVSSRVPAEDTSTMRAKRRLMSIVGNLKIKNRSLEISI